MWLAIGASFRWIPPGVAPVVILVLGGVGSAVVLFYVRTSRFAHGGERSASSD
jgi:hypothetical protein